MAAPKSADTAEDLNDLNARIAEEGAKATTAEARAATKPAPADSKS